MRSTLRSTAWHLTSAATVALFGATSFAGAPAAQLLFANYSDNTVRALYSDGSTQIVLSSANGLSGPFGSNALAVGPEGRLYVADYNSHKVMRFPNTLPSGETGEVVLDESHGIDTPDGLALHGDTIYIANREAGSILKLTANGALNEFDFFFGAPMSLAAGTTDLYAATSFGELLRYEAYSAAQRTFLGSTNGGNIAIALSADEDLLYVLDDGAVHAVHVDGSGSDFIASGLAGADEGLALEQIDGVDIALYAADFAGRIYRVDLSDGEVAQLADRSDGLAGPSGILLLRNGLSPCAGFQRCDANCDGIVNNFDIDAFVLALADPVLYREMFPECSRNCGSDTNLDSRVDNFDIEPFVDCIAG
jgi:hypothetical protein